MMMMAEALLLLFSSSFLLYAVRHRCLEWRLTVYYTVNEHVAPALQIYHDWPIWDVISRFGVFHTPVLKREYCLSGLSTLPTKYKQNYSECFSDCTKEYVPWTEQTSASELSLSEGSGGVSENSSWKTNSSSTLNLCLHFFQCNNQHHPQPQP